MQVHPVLVHTPASTEIVLQHHWERLKVRSVGYSKVLSPVIKLHPIGGDLTVQGNPHTRSLISLLTCRLLPGRCLNVRPVGDV